MLAMNPHQRANLEQGEPTAADQWMATGHGPHRSQPPGGHESWPQPPLELTTLVDDAGGDDRSEIVQGGTPATYP